MCVPSCVCEGMADCFSDIWRTEGVSGKCIVNEVIEGWIQVDNSMQLQYKHVQGKQLCACLAVHWLQC